MNVEQIRSEIASDDVIKSLIPDVPAIRQALAEKHTEVVEHTGGVGTVLTVLGKVRGPEVLDILEAQAANDSLVKWGFNELKSGRLDYGHPVTVDFLEGLHEAGVIIADELSALKALGVRPLRVSEGAIKRAVWADDGTQLI